MEEEIPLSNVVIRIDGRKCEARFTRYANPTNICILLYTIDNKEQGDEDYGAPWAKATVNYTVKLDDDYVMIKDWTENVGIPEALKEAGLLGALVPMSGIPYPVYRLLAKPKNFK